MPPQADVRPADFSAMLKKVRQRPDASLIESVLLRSQSLAVYSPQDSGHFGLALDHYAHFTSPIRRYPDLLVHRAIRYALTRGKPSDYTYSASEMTSMATHCSHNERRADEAERDVDERYKCAWMEKHVGSEFDGIVSGVTSFGLFVELKESQVSGLVHITQLPNDYYHFDPVRHCSVVNAAACSSASATRCACRCCARAWRIARSISASRPMSAARSTAPLPHPSVEKRPLAGKGGVRRAEGDHGASGYGSVQATLTPCPLPPAERGSDRRALRDIVIDWSGR